MNAHEPTLIKIDPPLPCCTFQGNGLCGKPAQAAWLTPTGGGQWIAQPICKDCAMGMARNYGVLPNEIQNEEQ